MSDQYTPTTEEVREAYLDRKDFEDAVSFVDRRGDEVAAAEFDRWLNTVQAEAWDEAVEALDRHYGDLSGLDRIVQDLDDLNPYREEPWNAG